MTMTDLAIPQANGVTSIPDGLPVPVVGDAAGLTVLGDWLAAADHAQQLARQLVHSFFVPQAYKPTGPNGVEVAVANAVGAILLGQSLGLDPLTSLQQIYVIHGRPGMYARMKVALAQREGHRIWEEEYSPERSTWAGQRKGSDDVVRITITMEDAKRAGWTSNAAYGKTPADLLAARCSSRVVDRIAADALFGIRSIEDIDDEPAPAPQVARVTAAEILARPLPANDAEPVVAEPAAAQAAQDGPIDDRTWRQINERFVALGVSGPGQSARRLAAISRLVGRTVQRGSELTQADGALVLDNLAGLTRQSIGNLTDSPSAPDEPPSSPIEVPAPADEVPVEEPPGWGDDAA